MAAYTTIDDPSAYFKVQLYTGNGSANHAITFDDTDTDMQPDFVWIKNRDAADAHCLFDSVRGATKVLHSNAETEEVTDTDTLDSFASDGFQVDADVKVNTNTEKYVAWCWKESATAGFDIVIYTGTGSTATPSHSLSAVPHVMMVKRRNTSEGWQVYHHKNTDAPETDLLTLDTSAATSDESNRWNDTAPTSSVFTVEDHVTVNAADDTYVNYLWTEKQGFSKFGTYTGNGNANGTFVYLGFRPAYVLVKCSSHGSLNWYVHDNKRPGYNVTNRSIAPNLADTDYTNAVLVDFVSNGFKWRSTAADLNTSGNTFCYFAFAEAPFVNSNGVPCNAR